MEVKKLNSFIKRTGVNIKANPKRVILNFLTLGINDLSDRMQRLLGDVLSIPEEEVNTFYKQIRKDFAFRHRNFEYYLQSNFEKLKVLIPQGTKLSATKKLLVGAYFTKEYSIQSAALFNPSMVAHPDQNALGEGSKRFIISLRSVGEGHISSIEFRTGVVDVNGNIALDIETGFATRIKKNLAKVYDKDF